LKHTLDASESQSEVGMKARVLIVDDHPIFRMGMAELLNQEDDFFVCGVAKDIDGGRKAFQEQLPDLAIIDISLAGENGLDLVKELSRMKNAPLTRLGEYFTTSKLLFLERLKGIYRRFLQVWNCVINKDRHIRVLSRIRQ
jgi:chemotaxis response regulator CheB